MRVTVRAVERLMRNGYIRNTYKTPWREYNAGFVCWAWVIGITGGGLSDE